MAEQDEKEKELLKFDDRRLFNTFAEDINSKDLDMRKEGLPKFNNKRLLKILEEGINGELMVEKQDEQGGSYCKNLDELLEKYDKIFEQD